MSINAVTFYLGDKQRECTFTPLPFRGKDSSGNFGNGQAPTYCENGQKIKGVWTFPDGNDRVKAAFPTKILEVFQENIKMPFSFDRNNTQTSNNCYKGTFTATIYGRSLTIMGKMPVKAYTRLFDEQDTKVANNNRKIIMAIAAVALLTLIAVFISKPVAIGSAVVLLLTSYSKQIDFSKLFKLVETKKVGSYNPDAA